MDKNTARLRSKPSPLRSAGTSESGNPQYRGLGIVFGGRDLYGDTFSPPREFLAGDDPDLKIGTDYFLRELADDIDPETKELRGAMEVPVFWDHGLGVLGTKRLGKAVPVRVTAEGIEYLIEVEKKRAQEYQAMIDELQNEGWLGLSSQTLPSFANFDWWTGEIESWYPAEMTLTVTPAEHRTRGVEQVRSLFRKYGIEVNMGKDKKTAEEEILEEENQPEEVALSEEVDAIFDGLSADLQGEEEMVVQNEALSFVVRSLNELATELRDIRTELAKKANTEDVQHANEQYVAAVQSMAKGLKDVLQPLVRTSAANLVRESSDAELDALRGFDQQPPAPKTPARRGSMYSLPVHAPGQN